MLNKNSNKKACCENRFQQYVLYGKELYLLKLKNWKKENRITSDYIIKFTTKKCEGLKNCT